MKMFKDTEGREWKIEINIGTAKRVRTELEIDIVNAADKVIERMVSDPILLCDVIYVICKPQADKANVTDEDFGKAMTGDVIESATFAFLEALTDFFPAPRRAILTKALAKMKKLEAMGLEMMDKKLDSDELENAMAKALGERSSSVPVSLE